MSQPVPHGWAGSLCVPYAEIRARKKNINGYAGYCLRAGHRTSVCFLVLQGLIMRLIASYYFRQDLKGDKGGVMSLLGPDPSLQTSCIFMSAHAFIERILIFYG